MDQNVLENSYLPISDVKKGLQLKKNISYIAHARTKGVKNIKNSQNVHFGTIYLS